MLAVLALLAVACGELTPPEAYSTSTSVTVVEGEDVEIDSQVAQRTGLSGGADEIVPTAAADYVPTLLVSGSEAVLTVGDESLTEAVDGPGNAQLTTVVDDLGGGVVVQEFSGPVVYWPNQGEPETLDETDARLLDVGYWDGSPRAFLDVGGGRIDWIQLVSEQSGLERERQTHISLAEGEDIIGFSASRDLQAVIVQDEECGELRFFGADGQAFDLLGPEAPECTFPGRPGFGAVALSPDGDAVAYTIVSYRGDGTEAATELVARDLVVGSEMFPRRRIGEDLDSVTSLTFDGSRVAYLKESANEDSVTVLNMALPSAENPVNLLGADEVYSVSFARIPVTVFG